MSSGCRFVADFFKSAAGLPVNTQVLKFLSVQVLSKPLSTLYSFQTEGSWGRHLRWRCIGKATGLALPITHKRGRHTPTQPAPHTASALSSKISGMISVKLGVYFRFPVFLQRWCTETGLGFSFSFIDAHIHKELDEDTWPVSNQQLKSSLKKNKKTIIIEIEMESHPWLRLNLSLCSCNITSSPSCRRMEKTSSQIRQKSLTHDP